MSPTRRQFVEAIAPLSIASLDHEDDGTPPDGCHPVVVERLGPERVALAALEAEWITDAPLDRVPEPGRRSGAVHLATVVDGAVVALEYRPGRTTRRRRSLSERFDRLAERPPGADGSRHDDPRPVDSRPVGSRPENPDNRPESADSRRDGLLVTPDINENEKTR